MTYTELVTRARRLARTDTNGASATIVQELAEDAIRQFSIDVHGFPKEETYVVEAKFDTNTDYAMSFSITGGQNAMTTADVVITATDRADGSGDTIASDLQTALQAATTATGDVTVSWTNFYFTFDTSATTVSTAMVVGAPVASMDYMDATALLGISGSLTDSSGTFAGGFPEDCTRRVTLDNRPLTIMTVQWDGYELARTTRNYFNREEYVGQPSFYYSEGSDLLITPAPNEQKELYIAYKCIPTITDAEIPSEIPTEYHVALAYHMASEMLLESFEDELSTRRKGQYYNMVRQYNTQNHNQNTSTGGDSTERLWWRYEPDGRS